MKAKRIAENCLFILLCMLLLLVVLLRVSNRYERVVAHSDFVHTHDNPVRFSGMEIAYDKGMEFTPKETPAGITFYFRDRFPIGILSITKGTPLPYEHYSEAIRKEEGFTVKECSLIHISNKAAAFSLSESVTTNNIIESRFFLDDGVVIDYIGPPENRRRFEATLQSAIAAATAPRPAPEADQPLPFTQLRPRH